MKEKTNSYYTPGNPKRERKISREWYERQWRKAFTDTEIIAIIKSLPPEKVIEGYFRFIPKEMQVNSGLSITLNIEGVESKAKVIEGQLVDHKALVEGSNDD